MVRSHQADRRRQSRRQLAPSWEVLLPQHELTLDAIPLHELPRICCTSRACRALPSWPMGIPQEGWLELDGVRQPPSQVELVSFNGRGMGVVLSSSYPARPGMHGLLTTPMHGGGCNHRPVFCCWQRPHPRDRHLQCIGLHFDFGDEWPIG